MNAPWFRLHANIGDTKVVWRAVAALGVSEEAAVGHLAMFWGKASQYASGGYVADVPDAQLEAWARWRGEPGRFAAFVREQHTDPDGRINEWDDYAGKLEERRERDRQRKAEVRRTSGGRPADSGRNSGATKRDDTRRDVTPVVAAARAEGGGGRDVPDTDSGRLPSAGEPSAEPPTEPLADAPPVGEYAVLITQAANLGVTERWGERPSPLRHGARGSLEAAETLRAAGVPVLTARDSIYTQCTSGPASKLEQPPRSLNYFVPGVLGDWESEQARHTIAPAARAPMTVIRAQARATAGRRLSPGEITFANALGGEEA